MVLGVGSFTLEIILVLIGIVAIHLFWTMTSR